MSDPPIRVLLIEDEPSDAKLLLHELRRHHPNLVHAVVDTEPTLRHELSGGSWDIVISDWHLPELNGLRALAVVKEAIPICR